MPSAMSKDGPLRKILECGKKGYKTGGLDTARGAMYELERAIELVKQGEQVLYFGKKLEIVNETLREFDIITSKKFIECKKMSWEHCVGPRADKFRSSICQQQKIANHYGKIFEFHSPNIPDHWQTWLRKSNIKFVIG